MRVAAADVVYEDSSLPRLTAAGSEVVRTIRCDAGTLVLNFPSTDAEHRYSKQRSKPAEPSVVATADMDGEADQVVSPLGVTREQCEAACTIREFVMSLAGAMRSQGVIRPDFLAIR